MAAINSFFVKVHFYWGCKLKTIKINIDYFGNIGPVLCGFLNKAVCAKVERSNWQNSRGKE